MKSLPTKTIGNLGGRGTAPSPSHNGTDPIEPPDLTTRVRVRRRPVLLAIGIALVLVAVIGAVTAFSAMRQTTDILVLADEVQQGQPITASDLTTKEINSDANLGAIPVDQRDKVIGKLASSRMPAGTVLLPTAVTDQVVPGEGLTMVGVTVTYPHLPSEPIVPGDMVRLVDTPREQDNPPVQGPINTTAQVYSTKDIPEAGETIVNVLVPEAEANWVAARAATKRVSIVLDSRER